MFNKIVLLAFLGCTLVLSQIHAEEKGFFDTLGDDFSTIFEASKKKLADIGPDITKATAVVQTHLDDLRKIIQGHLDTAIHKGKDKYNKIKKEFDRIYNEHETHFNNHLNSIRGE